MALEEHFDREVKPSLHEILRMGGLDAETAFDLLGARRYIDAARVTQGHVLDSDATSQRVGIRLVREWQKLFDSKPHANGHYMSVANFNDGSPPATTIFVNPSYEATEQRITYGHELGHHFLDLIAQAGYGKILDDPEPFCELFGREMAVSSELLVGLEASPEILVSFVAEHFGLEPIQAAYQLMRAGKLPRTFEVDMSTDDGDGDTIHPYYRNKVMRRIICYDCELGIEHPAPQPGTLPRFSWTDFQWEGYIPFVKCDSPELDSYTKHREFRKLNIHYGRWTAEDEADMPKRIDWEIKHDRQFRTLLGERVVSVASSPQGLYDDIPF